MILGFVWLREKVAWKKDLVLNGNQKCEEKNKSIIKRKITIQCMFSNYCKLLERKEFQSELVLIVCYVNTHTYRDINK